MMLVVVFAIQLLLFEIYLVANLKMFGVSHGSIEWLVLYVIFGIIGNLIVLIKARRVYIRLSALLLIVFMTYFAYRCEVDLPGQDWTKKFIGSDAGILYHILLGFLTAAPIAYAIEQGYKINRSTNLFKLTIGFFIVICTIDSFELMLLAAEKSRGDLFLVETGDDLYQWPGDLLSMRSLFSTMMSGYLISLLDREENSFFRKLGKFIILIIQTAQFGALLFYSQVLGSNKAVLIILGCWICLASVLIASRIVRNECSKVNRCSLGMYTLLWKTLLRTSGMTFIMGGLMLFIAMKMNFPFDKFRIFGFGTGENSSFHSRIDLIVEGFLWQFSISPFFGNAAADYLTLGEGRYIHSTVAHALTHTGVIGLYILTGIIIMAFVEQRFDFLNKNDNSKRCKVDNWQMKFICLIAFIMVMIVGIISSSLIWGVAWFAVGLFLASWRSKGPHLEVNF